MKKERLEYLNGKDEEVKRCKLCGRECLPTRNDAEDVWLVDSDGKMICGMCQLRRNNEN